MIDIKVTYIPHIYKNILCVWLNLKDIRVRTETDIQRVRSDREAFFPLHKGNPHEKELCGVDTISVSSIIPYYLLKPNGKEGTRECPEEEIRI